MKMSYEQEEKGRNALHGVFSPSFQSEHVFTEGTVAPQPAVEIKNWRHGCWVIEVLF